jgi:hypothetical protein
MGWWSQGGDEEQPEEPGRIRCFDSLAYLSERRAAHIQSCPGRAPRVPVHAPASELLTGSRILRLSRISGCNGRGE